MDGDKIRKWRPTKFADVIGKQNQNRIHRFQQQLLKGRLPDPVLITGIYGYAKTSLARLFLKSMDCRSRDPVTADPCDQCVDCQCFGKFYHGYPALKISYWKLLQNAEPGGYLSRSHYN